MRITDDVIYGWPLCQMAKGLKSSITLIEVNSFNDFKTRYNDIYNDIDKWY